MCGQLRTDKYPSRKEDGNCLIALKGESLVIGCLVTLGLLDRRRYKQLFFHLEGQKSN